MIYKLRKNLMISFPDIQDDKGRNSHTRTILEQMHSNHNYAEYLIKKSWLRNLYCTISKEDCNLFIRIVKEFIFSSRDSCARQVDILSRMEERNYNIQNKYEERIKALENETVLLRAHVNMQHSIIQEFTKSHVISMPLFRNSTTMISNKSITADATKPVVKLPLPTRICHIKKIMDGPNSFVGNLLIPPIHHLPDGYTYVLPSEVLKLYLAHGIEFNFLQLKELNQTVNFPSRSIFNSVDTIRKAKTFLSHKKNDNGDSYLLPIGLWSDGFDAGGASKCLRNVVKATTIHIPHDKISKNHVFLVGLGTNKGDHNRVREILMTDLDNLEKNQ